MRLLNTEGWRRSDSGGHIGRINQAGGEVTPRAKLSGVGIEIKARE